MPVISNNISNINTNPNINTSSDNINIGNLSLVQPGSGKTFSAFNTADDIITNVKQKVTETMWSNGASILSGSSIYLNPVQISASVEYYLDTYCYNPTVTSSATPQFAFGFGDRYGRGTINNTASTIYGLARTLSYQSQSYSPTACIYSQYRNLLLAPGYDQFTMENGQQMNSFYVINFSRNRMKERLDPGNWELCLVSGSDIIYMIDNAGDENQTSQTGDSGRIYAIVSGTISAGASLDNNGNEIVMGIAYPDMGILLINASGSSYTTGSNGLPCDLVVTDYGQNQNLFHSYITNSGSYFQARNQQNISSTYYFVRIKHNDYNFSNNPSYTTGSLGDLRHPIMINNPVSYVTTIGMYNNANELLAVAKLSKPFRKTFERESLIRVKLDY